MADDRVAADAGEIVTEFLLSTCRLQPTRHDLDVVVCTWSIANGRMPVEPEVDLVPLISGSSAELYIKPMLSCLGDSDVMYHYSTELAIPAGYPAPTQLPAEFHSRVDVREITDSVFPGYVYLKSRYLLTEQNDDDRYDAMLANENRCLRGAFREANLEMNGPAETMHFKDIMMNVLPLDTVYCVRCLHWPTQAADWPTRHRNYDWPDSATVDCVVSNGCDLVQVAHHHWRQHPSESKSQWRLSFSRAEIVLLNCWTPKQQIVYHMLRIFLKTYPLTYMTDGKEIKEISNYCIKTLMLWACERKSRNWWMSNGNVVRICVELLNILKVWLTDGRCQHYFINDCNLMDSVVSAIIPVHLTSLTESWLSTWFVNNYILKCAQQCPDYVLRLFDNRSTIQNLQLAAPAVVGRRRETALYDLLEVYVQAENSMAQVMYIRDQVHVTVRTYYYLLKELANTGLRLFDYATALSFLRISMDITKSDFNTESMDILSMICGLFIGRRRYSSPLSSLLLLSQAVKLMKAAVNNSRSTVQLIEIELSKAYLHRALMCQDSDNDSIYCLANVYLAVLYYVTGQYQTAIDRCTLVMRSQDHSQCSSHVVQGELLPKIDDDIDNTLGLVVFYQYIRTTALNQPQQTQRVSVFTTELFAIHLHFRCLSVTMCNQFVQTLSTVEVQRYRKHIIDMYELFIGDLLLFNSVHTSPKFVLRDKSLIYQRQRPTTNSAKLDTSKLVELLQQFAVEHLTTHRQFMAREFASVAAIVTTDFEAMYAYKRGDYQLCLQLSTQNVGTWFYTGRVITSVFVFSVFIQLLDDDIVSLTTLTQIFDPLFRRVNDDRYLVISQLTLSLYLMTQCQLKLRHSATQLAQTLDYIKVAQRMQSANRTLDQLTLKLIRHKIMLYLKTVLPNTEDYRSS